MNVKKTKFVSIFTALLLTACATTQFDAEEQASLADGKTGALVAYFDIPINCAFWTIRFKNVDTKDTANVDFTRGATNFFSRELENEPKIAPLPIGSYVPTSAKCSYSQINASGGQNQISFSMTFRDPDEKPVEILPGKLVYPGTYKFVDQRNGDLFFYMNQRQKIEDYVKTNYPDLYDNLVVTIK